MRQSQRENPIQINTKVMRFCAFVCCFHSFAVTVAWACSSYSHIGILCIIQINSSANIHFFAPHSDDDSYLRVIFIALYLSRFSILFSSVVRLNSNVHDIPKMRTQSVAIFCCVGLSRANNAFRL